VEEFVRRSKGCAATVAGMKVATGAQEDIRRPELTTAETDAARLAADARIVD